MVALLRGVEASSMRWNIFFKESSKPHTRLCQGTKLDALLLLTDTSGYRFDRLRMTQPATCFFEPWEKDTNSAPRLSFLGDSDCS
jgi:hypothetical protein